MKKLLTQSKYPHFPLLLCLTALLFTNSFLFAQPKDEHFQKENNKKAEILFVESSWGAALKKATATNKFIFVDAYASWCGPCKMLKATTFRDKETAAYFNENFINLSIDMEKGEGPDLATQWEIQGYPTLIIFDAAGKPLLGTVGFLEPKDLIKFGKQALAKKTD